MRFDLPHEDANPPHVEAEDCNCTIGILVGTIIGFVVGYLIATFAGR